MDYLYDFLILSAFIGVGLLFPYEVNADFKRKYGIKGWSVGLAILQGAGLIYFIYESENKREKEYIISFIIMIVLYLFAIGYCIWNTYKEGICKRDIIRAAFAQICASFGVFFLFVLFVMRNNKTKKRRRSS